MDLECSDDSLNAETCKCRDCNCGCSERRTDWIRSVKRKHDELEKVRKLNGGGDGVVRVEIGDECVALRQAVSGQQKAIQDLYSELEEERNAASSAANETMSMILRLQTEKAELEMEARQFKRFVEERTSHDQQEILALEELLYKREQTIHSLTCEIQAYKHRLMSYGLSESEVEGDYDFPPYEYPPLKCNVMHAVADTENDDVFDVDVEKYVFGETPRDRLRSLENRISQMERTPTYSQMEGEFGTKNIIEKVIVGQSPTVNKHSRKFSCDSSTFGPEFVSDSPRFNGSIKRMNNGSEDFSNFKKMDNVSEAGDNMTDRVYTVDSEFKGGVGGYDEHVTTPREFGNQGDFEDPYVKKLYIRLQALEADRESMRQAIISMSTDKAQVVLLKEIAQHLCKEMSPQRKMSTSKPYVATRTPFLSIFKWVTSVVLWRKKAQESKYMLGVPAGSMGLLLLLDKRTNARPWRCISSTQVGD